MTATETIATPDEQETDVIIEARNLSVTFGMDRGVSHVLNDVDIDVHREEILGIVGESGSGKSMFADSLLNAVVDPGVASGQIDYHTADGDVIDILELEGSALRDVRWEEISMVFQGALNSFNPTMAVGGHFVETLEAHNADVEAGMERARELLADVYLDPDRILESYPHELSGGMKQRALIALSLVLEPDVLVMDEPTAALDLLMQRSILSLLRDLQSKYALTIVFITHDLPLVAGLADRLAVLYAFEFVEVGPAETIDDPDHPYTRALLKAVPNLEIDLDEMRPIEGSSPDPVNIPEGCSYHPRCPLSDVTCESDDPPLDAIDSNGHRVACHHWEDATDALPFDTGDTERGGETDA
ncbi:ABC transporter ATP-binding protein [Natronolimnobius sp. AArcel1]|uniref:ABC transporter ATP-binding protein n=1 Tax=Natronolimnobius sp. AArcel1 TaxID=1679093 RepID=UPI0013EBA3E8|nr:ABC transporter ATP-binding protein [Natronolimnobius sp. AArcel1]NGM70561.1 ABC transporter ATP-binding protein [Natronolimnobius sp. AArcel1]